MVDSNVALRPASNSDWPQLWSLLQGFGGVQGDEETVRGRFVRLNESANWLIVMAFEAERALGYAAVQDYGEHLRAGMAGRVGRLHDMFVVVEDRRRGIGGLLMDHVVKWASDRVGYLQWQAHETRAAPFYEGLGYQGNPCPQPDYPEFEIDFQASKAETGRET